MTRHAYYVLDGHRVVETEDVHVWGQMFESADRVVNKTEKNGVMVSTVFLGLDHNFGDGEPLLFETMVFGGENDQDCERCSTWREAEVQHRRMCEKVFGHPPAENARHRVILED